MDTRHLYCIIMAGGSGTRFWPVSRSDSPKQFMPDPEGRSLFRDTYDRFAEILPKENIIVVTVSKYNDTVKSQVPELPAENILLEPFGKDTAPCTLYATCKILQRDPDAVTIVAPADHLVEKKKFQDTVMKAVEYASKNDILMTLGLKPGHPDTNFGYIQVVGGSVGGQTGPIKVKTFTEKPDMELAEIFLQTGEFLWNSGVFIWKARVIIEEYKKHLPELMGYFSGWENSFGNVSEEAFINKVYGECPRISLSYGILEKTEKAWVYLSDFGWNDVGSWESFYKYRSDISKDEKGNVVMGCKSILEADEDNLLISTNTGKLLAVRGLKNYMVVDTEDALLICPREDKRFNDLITELGLPEFEKFR